MATTKQPAPQAADAAAHATLSLGQSVRVQPGPGRTVRNTETGGFFAPDTPTPQTVTVTLLRRLADGDLVLV